MAKRYFNLENIFTHTFEVGFLRTEGAEEARKPSGTMGNHGMLVTPLPDGRVRVTGVNSQFKETKTVFLGEGETLGYDCGSVWVLANPEAIKCPVKRALRKNRLGANRLHYVEKDYVHKFDMDYSSLGEGYVTFSQGESRLAATSFGFATQIHRVVGPIDQRYFLGDFYVLKGTPPAKVASFIEAVCNGSWIEDEPCHIPVADGEVRSIDLSTQEIY